MRTRMSWRPFPITLDVMDFPPRKTPLRLAAAAAAACLLLTGCDPPDSGSSASPAVAGGALKTTEPTTGLCPSAGPKVATVLPELTGFDINEVTTNPCIPFSGLVADVLGLMVEDDAVTTNFKPVLKDFVGKVDNINTTVECAYETDNLGIRIYQQNRVPSSVGVVAVIRENVTAPFDIAFCFLKKQVLPTQSDPGVLPAFEPCWRGVRVPREPDNFTVLWVGSTEAVCDALEKSVH